MKTKRGILGLFLALCVVWSMLPLGAFAADENAGDGKTHISTAEDLRAINGNLAGHYVLDGDIDLTDCLGGGSWTPIGTEDKPFTGTFDGQDHSITGLYINASDSNYQGLFGYMSGTNSAVRNLTVSGTVRGNGSVGGVVGYNNGGTVTNCHNTVAVSGSSSGDNGDSIYVGGVVGYNSSGTVTNCSNTGTVSGDGNIYDRIYVGGVVGYNSSGTVTNCSNTGTVSGDGSVSGNTNVGGVVGISIGGTVTNCYNTGEVSSDVGSSGGVVGFSGGTVENCYNTGEVSDDGSSGGVVGFSGGTVKNCYNTGTVNGYGFAGGVVGSSSGTVTNCYYLEGTADIGIGDQRADNDETRSLSAENFAKEDRFPSDWFTSTWEMSELLGRPILRSNREGGSGTPESPYEIPDLATLERARDLMNEDTTAAATYRGASYVLTDDIDMSKEYGEDEKAWEPIGTKNAPFTGTFDGQDHSIRGLYVYVSEILSTHYQGLFGYVGEGTVKNLTVSGSVSGSSYIGGVVGWNNGGTIENCHNTVAVSGSGTDIRIGGVVGWNDKGTVKNCSNTGKVSGEGSVGGVVGENSGIGTVANCYNTGEVSDGAFTGGVVGWNGGTVENCSNTGKVSGTDTSAGGVVGENNGTVESCSNTGTVTGSGNSAGGVVGENSVISTVANCSNTGTVSGNVFAGGVVGQNNGGIIENCHNTVAVSGNIIGGVVGQNDSGTVENCSNAGEVSGSVDSTGGVVGYNSGGTVANCYNTGEVSDGAFTGGVVGQNSGLGTVTNCYNTGTVNGGSSVGGVVGYNVVGTVANCYYEQGKADSGIGGPTASNTGAELKTPTQFASGEVAWLLQDGQDSNIWGQTLTGETPDRYPVLMAFNPDAPRVFKVTFMNGENAFAAAYANSGGKVSAPNPAPTNEGHQFVGWYSDDTAWNFVTNTVISDLTLTASWRQLSSDTNVKSVTVKGTEAAPGEANTFTVTLPAGSSLPTANDIQITAAVGATYGDTLTTSDDGATWTFTVTAEDGTTTANLYTPCERARPRARPRA